MASDYRYNPFLNSLEPIAITGEIHVIPTNSPFTIRLHEVPLKEAPSTVSMTIGGNAGVEVAAEPAPGEFRCDYTTGADNDENWNTGLIQFNAADAGKTVVAAYNGMGSLASINAPSTIPTWAKYRGDGSDGDFVAAGGETISGIKQYKSFMIGADLTVNVGAEPLFIFCKGTVTINGTLNGKGGDGGTATSTGTPAAGIGVGGGGNGATKFDTRAGVGSGGGAGGNGSNNGSAISNISGISCLLNRYDIGDLTDNYGSENSYTYNTCFPFVLASAGESPAAYYQNLLALQFIPKAGGGGGGAYMGSAGGGGGGTITLAGETVTNNGTLNVSGGLRSQTATSGSNNRRAGGGGGGACIIIVANKIVINGTITVAGGTGGVCYSTAGGTNGGAGWYKIFTAG